MKIYAATTKGICKPENEDRIIINQSVLTCGAFTAELTDGVFAIADGVGGNNAGAVASHFVSSKLGFLNHFTQEEFVKINLDLIEMSNTSAKLTNMATTLAGLYIRNTSIKLFSVGNTRIYSLQSGKYLKQITNDDTTVNYLLSTGQITTQEVELFENKSEITACFGGGKLELFNIKIFDLKSISTFLITSDGVHDYLSADEMKNIIERSGICTLTCETIVSAAIANGSQDDASIILGEQ